MDTRVYPNPQLLIDGQWRAARAGRTIPIVNPASGDTIGQLAYAERADLDEALEAAAKGFETWKRVSAYERSKIMRKAANLLRERVELVATLMTMEQGKTAGRGEGRDPQRRRHHRLVRRGRAAHLWPRDPGARRGRLPARRQGAGRPGRRLHAVELPDQPDRAQALGRARRRLLDHRQGARGDAGLAGRADPRLRRRRRAGRRGRTWSTASRRRSRAT